MGKCIGILTAGGDSPGLNAAIRAVGRVLSRANARLIGFKDGFEGIAFDRLIVGPNSSCLSFTKFVIFKLVHSVIYAFKYFSKPWNAAKNMIPNIINIATFVYENS